MDESGYLRPRAAIPALTGLRGIGALWVLFYHLTVFQFRDGKGIRVFAVGYLGLDLFFLLSGFVLAHVYHGDFSTVSIRPYLRFFRARIARLYPMNIGALFIFAVLVLTMPRFFPERDYKFDVSSFVSSIFLVQKWWPGATTGWNRPTWSVSVELLAYFLFPFLMVQVRRIRSGPRALMLAVLLLGALVTIFYLAGAHNLNVKDRGGSLRMGGEFVSGMLVYQAVIRGVRVPTNIGVFAAMLLLGGGIAFNALAYLPVFSYVLILLLSVDPDCGLSSVLGSSAAIYFGDISYAVYLMQWPFLSLFDGILRPHGEVAEPWPFIWDAGLILSVIIVATIMHYGLEMPLRRLVRSIGGR